MSVILTVNAFYENRAERLIEGLKNVDPGCPYKLYVVHNCLPTVHQNPEPEGDLEYDLWKIRRLWHRSGLDFTYVARENTGCDVGAHRHTWLNHKEDDYKMMFFCGDGAVFNKDGWLKAHLDAYEDPTIALTSPEVCHAHGAPWCVRTSFFSMSKEFAMKLDWPEPITKKQTNEQEMTLFWPQAHALGLKARQVGAPGEWMNTVTDSGAKQSWAVRDEDFSV